jgi:hypothetical protein
MDDDDVEGCLGIIWYVMVKFWQVGSMLAVVIYWNQYHSFPKAIMASVFSWLAIAANEWK